MLWKRLSPYSLTLHGLLLALAGATVFLTLEVRQLRQAAIEGALPSSLVAGQVFEPFAALDLDGQELEVELAGSDRLLFFFTTTCPSCQENQQRWQALHHEVGAIAETLGVSFDPVEPTRAYGEEQQLAYPIVSLRDPGIFAADNQLSAVPFTVLLSADGRVRDSWLGTLSEQDLDEIRSSLSAIGA
ncbi:MAG: TlpA disulfide reductase family protein [Acidobacteriota bacterium]